MSNSRVVAPESVDETPEQDLIDYFTLLDCDGFILALICENLDIFSLYYLSRTNHAIQLLTQDDHLWERHLKQHYTPEEKAKVALQYSGNFNLFSAISNNKYQELSPEEKEFFILVRANDLSAIKNCKMNFTIELLQKCDANNTDLFDLIRKNKNPLLNDYIYLQIYDFCPTEDDKILFGIELDQSEGKFKTLIEAQDNINRVIDRWTFLQCAAFRNSSRTVKLLLTLNADVDSAGNDSHMETPLHIAAKNGHSDIVSQLLCKNAYVKNTTSEGKTPLHLSAREGHLETAKLLLPYFQPNEINEENSHDPLLYIALNYTHFGIFKLLIENKANVHVKDDHTGRTLLHMACQSNYHPTDQMLPFIEMLISAGAHPSVKDFHGNTPANYLSKSPICDIAKNMLDISAAIIDTDWKEKLDHPSMPQLDTRKIIRQIQAIQEKNELSIFENFFNFIPVIKKPTEIDKWLTLLRSTTSQLGHYFILYAIHSNCLLTLLTIDSDYHHSIAHAISAALEFESDINAINLMREKLDVLLGDNMREKIENHIIHPLMKGVATDQTVYSVPEHDSAIFYLNLLDKKIAEAQAIKCEEERYALEAKFKRRYA